MKGALLWKRMLNEGLGMIDPDDDRGTQFRNLIVKLPIIVDSRPWDERWSLKYNVDAVHTVPFPDVWIEGTMKTGELWGAAVRSDAILPPDWVQSHTVTWPSMPGFKSVVHIACIHGSHGFSPRNMGTMAFPISTAGKILIPKPAIIMSQFAWDYGPDIFQVLQVVLVSIGAHCCDVLQLLSCKNVGLRPHDNDPKQVHRAVKRHGGKPGDYRYHTLIVRPPGAKSTSPGIEIGDMPRHVCRGHYSEYGPEFGKGLLFGKYAGRFFVAPHVRGNEKNGIVEKDYQIQPTVTPAQPVGVPT